MWLLCTDLDQVGIPGIATDTEIVVAEFLPGRLAKDVACAGGKVVRRGSLCRVLGSLEMRRGGGIERSDARYLEARTKRPDMIAESA